MGQEYDGEREGKVSNFERGERSPHLGHWKEEEEGENGRTYAPLDNIRMD